jgi:hypothetical protein
MLNPVASIRSTPARAGRRSAPPTASHLRLRARTSLVTALRAAAPVAACPPTGTLLSLIRWTAAPACRSPFSCASGRSCFCVLLSSAPLSFGRLSCGSPSCDRLSFCAFLSCGLPICGRSSSGPRSCVPRSCGCPFCDPQSSVLLTSGLRSCVLLTSGERSYGRPFCGVVLVCGFSASLPLRVGEVHSFNIACPLMRTAPADRILADEAHQLLRVSSRQKWTTG